MYTEYERSKLQKMKKSNTCTQNMKGVNYMYTEDESTLSILK